jgi:ATP-dependent Clp protease ATP-binding subunit ClpA
MALTLDADAQAALDLAKRAVPEGSELDVPTLAAALCQGGGGASLYPALAQKLLPPKPLRPEVPARVSVAAELRPVLGRLAEQGRPVSAEELLRAILETDSGRKLLATGWRASPERSRAMERLASFGRMLTVGEPPHGGVVEMERPLRALVRTLSKMRRRNAILVGPPGTGKSALVYDLARRLVHADFSIPIPEHLRDADLFELSPTFLRSGASMVGQYDERVKELIGVLTAHPKIILFVDEIHSLFQSSIHARGPFTDTNESFKGPLGRGEITCIGCTTPGEFRHYLDDVLARRFSLIKIEPPSHKAILGILRARRPRLEAYYAPLRIPDGALECAVRLADDYLPTRYQPDKTIQLLDEACAWCATSDPRPAEVTEDALWQALEDRIGHSVAREGRFTESAVLKRLQERIVGQDDALKQIARAFVSGLGGWSGRSGPRGVYFFCGPTGVGKTETALRLAEILGGGRRALLEVDCNTLQGSAHDIGPAINVLLGPPPGYVGYARGQGGVLSKIRDEPESVVLFDEIEKAAPGVAKILLQILDQGRVEDSDGSPLDFRRSFLVFTTNAGCVYDDRTVGFAANAGGDDPRVDVEAVRNELRSLGYGEEFLGRVDGIVVFRALEPTAIRTILGRQLEALGRTAAERGYALEWEPALIEHLAVIWQPRFGVRHLATILRHRVVEQLSLADAQGELRGVRGIRLAVLARQGADQGAEEGDGSAGSAERERSGEILTIRVA